MAAAAGFAAHAEPGVRRSGDGARADLARAPFVATWDVSGGPALAVRRVGAFAALGPHRLLLTAPGGAPAAAVVAAAADAGLRVAVRLAPDAATPAYVADLVAAGARRVVLALATPDDVGAGRAAEAAHAASLALEVETTLRPATAALVGPAGRVAAALDPVLWRVVLALPARPGAHDFPPATTEAVFRQLVAWHRRTGLPVTTTNAPAFRRVVLGARGVRLPHPLPLGDGKGLVFVSRSGRIQPSEHLPLSAGDLATDRLVDVYRASRLFRTLRATWRLEGRCGRCRFQAVCGGSRARAFAASADLLADDPACAYDPPRVMSSAPALEDVVRPGERGHHAGESDRREPLADGVADLVGRRARVERAPHVRVDRTLQPRADRDADLHQLELPAIEGPLGEAGVAQGLVRGGDPGLIGGETPVGRR
jgi:hypothetical protein